MTYRNICGTICSVTDISVKQREITIMNSQTTEILSIFAEELNVLLEAKTAEEVLYGLIAYLHNGLSILNEVMARFENKN